MTKLSFQNIKEFIQKRILPKIDKKILIYLIFVCFSTVFWFLNKLGNEFNSTINYPVRYANLPSNKVLVSELPPKLKLQVTAPGYSLLKYKLSPVPFPVVINLNDYAKQISKESVERFTIHTRQIKSDINQQLGKDIVVLDVLPDTITFHFANVINKKVALAANVNLNFAPQCMLDGNIRFSPDSIVVSGPEFILDTIQYIFTKKHKFKDLNKPIERNISLQEIENLSFAKKKVNMKLPVSKFTEADISTPIYPINVPDSLYLITFPQKAKISYLVSLSNYDKINELDFRLEVDYLEIEKLLGQKLSVNLKHSTDKASSISFTPTIVEYIIEKKND